MGSNEVTVALMTEDHDTRLHLVCSRSEINVIRSSDCSSYNDRSYSVCMRQICVSCAQNQK